MKYILLVLTSLILVSCHQEKVQGSSLAEKKRAHKTNLIAEECVGFPVEEPPSELFELVQYSAPLGEMPAYISKPNSYDQKHPAIIWLVGGFGNSISDIAWSQSPPENDQSASVFWKKGIITMYPSLRGGNENPGHLESLYGEVDDVISAYEYLSSLEYVDPSRIYLGGHSTGGTLALLVAESSAEFRSVFSLGPVDKVSRYGQDSLTYDIQDRMEDDLRAPVNWLHLIQNRTFVFEGTEGNFGTFQLLEDNSKNEMIRFYPIAGHDHFSVIHPISSLIADKILQDTKVQSNIEFLSSELNL